MFIFGVPLLAGEKSVCEPALPTAEAGLMIKTKQPAQGSVTLRATPFFRPRSPGSFQPWILF
jgi:hypothetical protein